MKKLEEIEIEIKELFEETIKTLDKMYEDMKGIIDKKVIKDIPKDVTDEYNSVNNKIKNGYKISREELIKYHKELIKNHKELKEYLKKSKDKDFLNKAIIYGVHYSKGIYDELSETSKMFIRENKELINDIQNQSIEIKKLYVNMFEILKGILGNKKQLIKYIEKKLKK